MPLTRVLLVPFLLRRIPEKKGKQQQQKGKQKQEQKPILQFQKQLQK